MRRRRLVAEFVGTGLFLVAIVGSGIATSTEGAASAQLFQHAVVVGAALSALIFTFGPVSGAHLNPSISFADAVFGGLERRLAAAYTVAQVGGAMVGVALANWMFGEQLLALATIERTGVHLLASEALATFGLVVVIFGTSRLHSPLVVPIAAGAYVTAAIYFTSSASFANPAVTLGRVLTDTWTGIAPSGIPWFVAGQALGTVAGVALTRYLFQPTADEATQLMIPVDTTREEASIG